VQGQFLHWQFFFTGFLAAFAGSSAALTDPSSALTGSSAIAEPPSMNKQKQIAKTHFIETSGFDEFITHLRTGSAISTEPKPPDRTCQKVGHISLILPPF
jgi:hypothetical protein